MKAQRILDAASIAALVLVLAGAVASCTGPAGSPNPDGAPSGVTVWHDYTRGVTCYVLYSQSISCVSDSQSNPQ